MTRLLTSFLLLLAGSTLVLAQNQDERDCSSDAHQATLMQDSDYAQRQQLRMQKMRLELESGGNRSADCANTIVLPMVFHFQNVNNPDVQCLRDLAAVQLQILNDDYQGVNGDIDLWSGGNGSSQFFPGASNGESCIQFCTPTTGHPTGFGLAEGDPAITINQVSGSFSGDWSGYINVFVRNIGALGFSPLGGEGDGDGVTIDNSAFGSGAGCSGFVPSSPYNLGRTLTHELGHYLGLSHIWGGGCGQDDGIADTPNQSSSYGGCPGNTEASCGSTDMHMNYMDYVFDQCMYMFSADQVGVMDAYAAANLQNVISNAATCGDGGGGGPVTRTIDFGTTEILADEGTADCTSGGTRSVILPLTISGAPEESVTVDVMVTGSAVAGEDFNAVTTTVIFPAGGTADQFIEFSVLEDNVPENDEFIELNFSIDAAVGNITAGESFAYIALLNDDVALSANNDIQTTANDDSGFAFFNFGPFSTVDFFDQNTGAVMMTLINNSDHDFGCTQVMVDRGSGSNPGAEPSAASEAAFLTDKTFFVSPENNDFSAAYRVRLYYTAAEVAGFLQEADQPVWDLRMYSSGNFIGNATELIEATVVQEAFGNNVYFESTFTDGLSGLAIGVAPATLPVEMTRFTATAQDKFIALDWNTAREESNEGFTVQRRTAEDNRFQRLDWVGATGNESGASYTFNDRTAVSGVTYFYQLLQRDTDGTETASAIVSATLKGGARVSAWPNPAGDRLEVTIATETAGHLRLATTDGRTLVQRNFTGGETSSTLNLTDVPAGVYLLMVKTDRETLVRKIVRK